MVGTPAGAATFSTNGTNGSKNTTALLTQAGTYNFQVTITDAKYLTKPMTNTAVMVLMKPGSELMEYSCPENNKEIMEGHIKDDFVRTR